MDIFAVDHLPHGYFCPGPFVSWTFLPWTFWSWAFLPWTFGTGLFVLEARFVLLLRNVKVLPKPLPFSRMLKAFCTIIEELRITIVIVDNGARRRSESSDISGFV
ncbi:hypothetical protein M514_16010 [Trichuris suis]|uniref:Uncharacterized protein n=1 Tax=Trichuris suis TaxID=68888 RepID=A0A085NR04_9BILA|nr:hypothetical protein M514_16010 [Trichuris suis]